MSRLGTNCHSPENLKKGLSQVIKKLGARGETHPGLWRPWTNGRLLMALRVVMSTKTNQRDQRKSVKGSPSELPWTAKGPVRATWTSARLIKEMIFLMSTQTKSDAYETLRKEPSLLPLNGQGPLKQKIKIAYKPCKGPNSAARLFKVKRLWQLHMTIQRRPI